MGWGFRGSSHCGVWGWWSKRAGGRGQCRGTTTEHRSSPWAPHQPKLACNSGTRTFCSARKRCNSNGEISTFEIRVGELHATFLRNHNMRRHKGTTKCPKQKTTQAQKTPTTPTAATTATSTGALHPLCGGAPVTWRCTRTEEVHCLRIGCSAPTYKNKRGTDRTHLLPATTSPGASGGLIVPHGHCPTASVVQVARSDSCCALLILTPAATPQEPKPPQHNQGQPHPGSRLEDSHTQAVSPRVPKPESNPEHDRTRHQANRQPRPRSTTAARRARAPRLPSGTTRPPRCTPWRPSAHTHSQ